MGEKQQQEKHTKKKEERCAEEKPFCVFEEVRLLKLFFSKRKKYFIRNGLTSPAGLSCLLKAAPLLQSVQHKIFRHPGNNTSQ